MTSGPRGRWHAIRSSLASWLVRGTVGLAVLALLLWIVAARGTGMGTLVPWALARAVPDGWTVDVVEVEGDWRSGLTLRQVSLVGPATSVYVDRLRIRYSLAPLLDRHIHVSEVEIVRPRVLVAREATSSPQDASDDDGASEPGSVTEALADIVSGSPFDGWTLDVDRIAVTDGELHIETPGRSFAAEETYLSTRTRWAPSGLSFRLDSLAASTYASIRSGGPAPEGPRPEPVRGRLLLTGGLSDGVLELTRLSFSTPHGRLDGIGSLPVTTGPTGADTVRLSLSGTDLDIRYLPVTVPAQLQGLPRLSFDVRAAGQRDSAVEVTADLRAEPAPEDAARPSALMRAGVEMTLERWSPTAPLEADVTLTRTPAGGASGAEEASDLLGAPLQASVALTRSAESSVPTAGLDVTIDLRRGATAAADGPTAWQELGGVEIVVGSDSLSWNADLIAGTMSVAGEGVLSWAGDAPRVSAESFLVEALDLSAISSAWPETSISGRARGQVSGSSVDALSGDVTLHVSRSSVGGSTLDSVDLTARLEPRTVSGRARVDRDGAEFGLQYVVILEDSAIRGRATEFVLAQAAGDSADASGTAGLRPVRLSAHGRIEATWVLGSDRPRGSAALTLDSASVAGLRLRDASAAAELSGETLTADIEVTVLDALSTPIRLSGLLDARGLEPTAVDGTLELRATRAIDDAPESRIDSLLATVTADGNGRFALDGALLPAEGGRLDIAGEAVAGDAGWSLDGSARGHLEPASLFGALRADSLDLEASARWTDGAWKAAGARLLSEGTSWNRVIADTMFVSARLDSLTLALDTLRVASNVADLDGGGRVTMQGGDSSAIRISGHINDLSPLIAADDTPAISTGQSRLEATLSGRRDSLALTASASVRALAYGAVRASGLDVSASALLALPDSGGRALRDARLELGIDRFALPDTVVRRIDAVAEGGSDSLRLDVSALVDDVRRGTLHARLDRLPSGRRATLERLDLQLDRDRWSLADTARLDYGDTGGYALRSFILQSGDQAIEIDGSVGTDGALDVVVDADSVDVGTVADLVGLPGVDGWLAGRTRLGGTTARPTGHAYLRGALHLPDAPPAPGRISVRSDGSRVSADIDLHSEAGGHLRIDGSLRIPGAPVTDESGDRPPLDVRIVSEGFRLTAVQPFLDQATVSGLDGVFEVDVRVQGSTEEPEVRGTLRVAEGRMRLPTLGVDYEDVRANVSALGSELSIDSVRVRSGEGSASLTGTVSLANPYPIDLAAYLVGFRAIRTDAYHATVSGQLTAGGDVDRPVVNGEVDIESLDVFLGNRVESRDLEDVELTPEDLRMLRDRFGYVPPTDEERTPPLADRLTADLVVHLGRDSWLRNRSSPELSVPFTGDVDVRLRPGEESNLQGQVTIIAGRGFVEQFGRRFELREGTVTFDGPPEATRVDLSATYRIPSRDNPDDAEATIVLSVEGTQESLSLELSSEPPMENADIVSYLATGRPAAGALAFEGESGGGLAGAGANLALDELAGVIESAAGQSVGLDVVEIRREGLRGATLVAGKYLSPRLYVGFAQPVTLREGDGLSIGDESESEIQIEIEALRWLLLNFEGSSSAVRLFLKVRHAY